MEKKRDVDDVGHIEFFTEFVKYFGLKRAVYLTGWAVLWGVAGVENGPEFREKLKAQGVSRATAFRIAQDFRRFQEHLEAKEGRSWAAPDLVSAILRSQF